MPAAEIGTIPPRIQTAFGPSGRTGKKRTTRKPTWISLFGGWIQGWKRNLFTGVFGFRRVNRSLDWRPIATRKNIQKGEIKMKSCSDHTPEKNISVILIFNVFVVMNVLTIATSSAGLGNDPVLVLPAGGKAQATPRPAAPAGLKAELRGEGLRISWDKAAGDIAGYNLYLAGDAEKPARIVSAQLITDNKVDLKKVNSERLYRFYLTSVSKRGIEGEPSAVLEVKLADLRYEPETSSSLPVLVLTVEPTPTATEPPRKMPPVPPAKPKMEAPALMKGEPVASAKAAEPVPTKTETPAPVKVEPSSAKDLPQAASIDKKWLSVGKVRMFTIRPGDGMARLSWEAVSGAVGYHLYVSYDEKTFTLINKKGPQNILELNIRSLTNGKTYYFAVSAVNEALQESEKTMLPAVPKASP
jgi:hypothetical protein